MENILISKISFSKTNPRKHFDEKAMTEMTENIKKFGVLQPVLVRNLGGDTYELVAGERRMRAAKSAGLTEIPAISREMTDEEALEIQVIENLHRADLHPMEEAEGYERLMRDSGYNAGAIAGKVGKSTAYIYGRMKLCELSPKAREAFFKDEINASMALLIARIPDQELQDDALKNILPRGENSWERGMTYKDAVSFVHDNYMLRLKGAPFNTKDADLDVEAGSCADCQKRTGNQKELFPDVGNEDNCTDPKCFQNKVKKTVSRKILAAQSKGIKVLRDKEARSALSYNSTYVDLETDLCYDDVEQRTYKELLGKHDLVKTIAVGTDNTFHELYLKTDVEAALAEKYDWAKPQKAKKPEKPYNREAAAKAQKLAELELSETMDAIVAQVSNKDTWDSLEFWKIFVCKIAVDYSGDGVLKRHGITEPAYDDLEKLIKKAGTVKELKILAVELLYSETYNMPEDMVKYFGLDKKAIKKVAKAKLKELEAAEAAKGKKEK